MASLNKIMLIGNIGRIETRTFQDGKVVNATLAVTERYKKRDGSQVENTEWFNLVIGGGTAVVAEKYVQKGSPLFVEGRLRTRIYTDREGEERSIKEVMVQSMVLLSQKMAEGGTATSGTAPAERYAAPAPAPVPPAPSLYDNPDEDLPF